jgi:putative transposase
MLSPLPLVGSLPDFVICVSPICERFIGSVRRECLDHFLLIGSRSITRVLKEYVDYFNHLRPHQGLGQRIPGPSSLPTAGQKPLRITRVPVLGGLHHSYQLAA